MKFSILALSTLLAFAAAEATTTAETVTATLTPEQSCAKNCNSTDRCCVADCYKVPCPNDTQANDTNSCVAACPQGTGTAEDTKKYTDCQNACFSSHFFATGAAAQETGTSTSSTTSTGTWATATATTTSGSKSSNNDSNDNSASASTFGASSTSTGVVQSTNAASNVKLGASSAGLFGLVLAAFAL